MGFKKKAENKEQKAKRKAREAKEILKWEKEKAKPRLAGYLFYFVFIVAICYLVDEVTSQIGTQMQDALSNWIAQHSSLSTDNIVSQMTNLSVITGIGSGLALLYRPLSDRFGRKIFLIINVLGMGVGLILVGLTNGIVVWLMGATIIAFFTPHDMQVIYIQECAPKEKRATYYTIIKSFATLGLLVVPLLRNLFMKDGYQGWQFVYFIPSIVAIAVAILSIFFMRETDPFIETRLKFLKMSDEEREEAAKKDAAEAQKNGIIAGFKYIFKHKRILWLLLAAVLIWCGMAIPNYYNVIMKYGFSGLRDAETVRALSNTMVLDSLGNEVSKLSLILQESTQRITNSLWTFAIGSAIVQLIPGFIADKLGRRGAALFSVIVTLVSFVLFWIFSYALWQQNTLFIDLLIGFFAGSAVGSFWLCGDMIQFILAESVPTANRVSTINSFDILYLPGTVLGQFLPSIICSVITDVYLPLVSLIVTAIGLTGGIIVMLLKVKETKGVDISNISTQD